MGKSYLIEMAKKLGVSIEELEKMSREMGSEDGAIPLYSGSGQTPKATVELVEARREKPDSDGSLAEQAYEQRKAEEGERTDLQQAALAVHSYETDLYVRTKLAEQKAHNRYTALGDLVRRRGR